MTTEPVVLRDALTHALGVWQSHTGQTPPPAVFCGNPMPLDPAVLCARIGCDGNHSSNGQDAWTTTKEIT